MDRTFVDKLARFRIDYCDKMYQSGIFCTAWWYRSPYVPPSQVVTLREIYEETNELNLLSVEQSKFEPSDCKYNFRINEEGMKEWIFTCSSSEGNVTTTYAEDGDYSRIMYQVPHSGGLSVSIKGEIINYMRGLDYGAAFNVKRRLD